MILVWLFSFLRLMPPRQKKRTFIPNILFSMNFCTHYSVRLLPPSGLLFPGGIFLPLQTFDPHGFLFTGCFFQRRTFLPWNFGPHRTFDLQQTLVLQPKIVHSWFFSSTYLFVCNLNFVPQNFVLKQLFQNGFWCLIDWVNRLEFLLHVHIQNHRDHPFKTSANFHDLWPLPSAVILMLSAGKFGQSLTPPLLENSNVLNG